MKPKTKKECDAFLNEGCESPECKEPHPHDELFLFQICHEGAGFCVSYHRSGTLTVECRICRKPIDMFKIAEK